MGRGQAVRRGTLDPVFEGSNPSAPAKGFGCLESDRFHWLPRVEPSVDCVWQVGLPSVGVRHSSI